MKFILTKVILYAGCLFCAKQPVAQNNIIRGVVRYQNSNFTKATGVLIKPHPLSGDQANQTFSDDNGAYQLVYNNRKSGDPVRIFVGDQTRNNEPVELVNTRELDAWNIPSDPVARSFDIVVCRKGARDAAARQYYQILKGAADRQLEEKIKELSILQRQFEQGSSVIRQQREEIAGLREQADSVKLYREAMDIASINKDGASSRILKYLALLDAGSSIEEARKALNVEKAYQEGKASLDRVQSSLEEISTSIGLLMRTGENEKAISQIDTLILLLEQPLVDKFLLAQNLVGAANLCLRITSWTDDYLQKGLAYVKRAQQVQTAHLSANSPLNTSISFVMASLYSRLRKYPEADSLFRASLTEGSILKEQDNDRWLFFSASCNVGLGEIAMNQRGYAKADSLFANALTLLRAIAGPVTDETIVLQVAVYQELAKCRQEMYLDHSADTTFRLALRLLEDRAIQQPVKWSVYLSRKWKQFGEMLEAMHQYAKAENAFRSAVDVIDRLPAPARAERVNDIEDVLTRLSEFYEKRGWDAKAEREYFRYIRLFEEVSKTDSSFTGSIGYAHRTLANFYRDRGEYAKAIPQYHLALNRQSREKRSLLLFTTNTTYRDLAHTYQLMGNASEAAIHYQAAFRFDLRRYDEENYKYFYSRELGEKLVRLYDTLNRRDSAERLFIEVDKRYAKLYRNDPKDFFNSYLQFKRTRADYYHDRGDHLKAQHAYAELARLCQMQDSVNTGRTAYEPVARRTEGEHFLADGNFSGAINRFELSGNMIKNAGLEGDPDLLHVRLAENQLYLVTAYWKQLLSSGNMEARRSGNSALGTVDSLLSLVKKSSDLSGRLAKQHSEYKRYFETVDANNIAAFRAVAIYDSLKKVIAGTSGPRLQVPLYRRSIALIKQAFISFPPGKESISELCVLHGNLSWAFLFESRFKESEESAREGLKIDPGQVWIRLNLAHALLYQGRDEEARGIYLRYKDQVSNGNFSTDLIIKDLDELEQAGLRNSGVAAVRRLVKGELNDVERQFYYRAIYGGDITDSSANESAWLHRQLGDVYQRQGMYDSALISYYRAWDIQKNRADSLTNPELSLIAGGIGKLWQVFGKYDQAGLFLEKSVRWLGMQVKKNHPVLNASGDDQVLNDIVLGNYNSAAGKSYDQTSAQTSEALADKTYLSPNRTLPYTRRWLNVNANKDVYVSFMLNNYSTAIRTMRRDLGTWMELPDSMQTGFSTAAHLLSFAYFGEGHYDDALRYAQMAIALNHSHSNSDVMMIAAYHNQAAIYFALDSVHQGNACMKNAASYVDKVKRSEKGRFSTLEYQLYLRTLYHRWEYNLSKRNYRDALSDLLAYGTLSETADVLNRTGLCLYYLGDYANAIAYYDRSFGAATESDTAIKNNYYNNVGMAYLKIGKLEKAEKAFQEYQRRVPDDGRVYRNWAVYYATKGEKNRALQQLQRALEKGYRDCGWLNTEKSIDPLRSDPAFDSMIRQACGKPRL